METLETSNHELQTVFDPSHNNFRKFSQNKGVNAGQN